LPAALGLAAALGLVAGPWGLAALAAALAAGALLLTALRRRLGGWTGDGLGAVEQAGEMAALLVLSAALT
ncbi:MAG: adenosylcobinamide-GDP ribazoletransferase, partial [Pseudomonadota bacterium]